MNKISEFNILAVGGNSNVNNILIIQEFIDILKEINTQVIKGNTNFHFSKLSREVTYMLLNIGYDIQIIRHKICNISWENPKEFGFLDFIYDHKEKGKEKEKSDFIEIGSNYLKNTEVIDYIHVCLKKHDLKTAIESRELTIVYQFCTIFSQIKKNCNLKKERQEIFIEIKSILPEVAFLFLSINYDLNIIKNKGVSITYTFKNIYSLNFKLKKTVCIVFNNHYTDFEKEEFIDHGNKYLKNKIKLKQDITFIKRKLYQL